MSLMTCASCKSLWRGYEYFMDGKVLEWQQENETEFDGLVSGNENNYYNVHIDIKHPRKSTCDCPHANGRRVICKHMIAVFFKAFPKEAEKYYNDVMSYDAEDEIWQEEIQDKVIKYVNKMKKDDLIEVLLQVLFEGPEWQYERFIREHIEW